MTLEENEQIGIFTHTTFIIADRFQHLKRGANPCKISLPLTYQTPGNGFPVGEKKNSDATGFAIIGLKTTGGGLLFYK